MKYFWQFDVIILQLLLEWISWQYMYCFVSLNASSGKNIYILFPASFNIYTICLTNLFTCLLQADVECVNDKLYWIEEVCTNIILIFYYKVTQCFLFRFNFHPRRRIIYTKNLKWQKISFFKNTSFFKLPIYFHFSVNQVFIIICNTTIIHVYVYEFLCQYLHDTSNLCKHVPVCYTYSNGNGLFHKKSGISSLSFSSKTVQFFLLFILTLCFLSFEIKFYSR